MDRSGEFLVLGRGLRIVGDLEATGPVRVEGFLQGRLFTPDRLEVAAGARVEGIVQARAIDVRGSLSGIVRAAEEVRVFSGGELAGDIEAPRVRFIRVEEESGPVVEPVGRGVEARPLDRRPPERVDRAREGSPPDGRRSAPVAAAVERPAAVVPAAPEPKAPTHAAPPGPLPDWSFPRRAPVWAPRSGASGSDREESAGGPSGAEEPRLPSITGDSRQIVVKRR